MIVYGPGTINGEADDGNTTPLGIKVTHKMMIQTVYSVQQSLPAAQRLSSADTYLSLVPSTHMFEQVLFGFTILYLVKCGFSSPPPVPEPAK